MSWIHHQGVRRMALAVSSSMIVSASVVIAPAAAQGLDFDGNSRMGAFADVSQAVGGIMAVARGAVIDYWDVSTPTQPQRLSDFGTSGRLVCVIYTGARTYAVTAAGVVHVIDSSTPLFPTSLGAVFTSLDEPRSCYLDGERLFVNDRTSTWAYDVTSPASIPEIGPLPTGESDAIPSGNTLFTLDGSFFLSYDISDLENPELIGGGSGGGMAFVLHHDGSRAIILGPFGDQLRLFDVSDPAKLAFLDDHTLSQSALDLDFRPAGSGGARVGGDKGGALLGTDGSTCPYSITDNLIDVGTCREADDATMGATGIRTVGDGAIFFDLAFAAEVIAILDHAHPLQAPLFVERAGAAELVVADDVTGGRHVYAAPSALFVDTFETGDASRWRGDVSGIRAASHGRITPGSSLPGRGHRGGTIDVVLAASEEMLHVIDATDLENPSIVGTWEPAGEFATIEALDMFGNHAIVIVNDDPNIVIVDFSDPSVPNQVASLFLPTGVSDVEVRGPYAYLLSYLPVGLDVIDLSDPTSPADVGSGGVRGVDLDIVGDRAYVVNSDIADDPGLRIVDLSSPTSPSVSGVRSDFSASAVVGFQTTSAHGVTDLVAVTEVDGDLVLYDATDPGNVTELDRVTLPQPGASMDMINGTLQIAAGASGLLQVGVDGITPILPDDGPSQLPWAGTLRMSSRPNPFNPQMTLTIANPVAGHATLRIHDALGREIVQLHAGQLAEGVHRFSWDGRNEAGTAAAAGVYFVDLVADAYRARHKVTMAP